MPISISGDRANQGREASEADTGPVQTVLTKAGNSAAAGAARVSEPPVPRTARGAEAGGQIEHGTHLAPAQTSATPDASTLVRDPAGTHSAMSASGGDASSSTTAAAGSASRQTFAALDAGADQVVPGWIHAGTQRAEAGYQDPTLGWVGVRADVNASGVHATVLPGSADAAQALGGHMAGLNAYLAAEHTPVETLTLAMPESRESGLRSGQNAGHEMNQSMNQGAGQNAGQGGSSETPSNPQPVMPAMTAAATTEIPAPAGRLGAASDLTRSEGAHISVMA